jgi:hypothetical protein
MSVEPFRLHGVPRARLVEAATKNAESEARRSRPKRADKRARRSLAQRADKRKPEAGAC